MHSSLVVTTEGLPLGIAAIKFWTRKEFKGTNALKKKINSTRVPIEDKESVRWLDNIKQTTALLADPERCIHIGDRESDIYELFCTAHDANTHFLVRTCVDRLAGDGQHTISEEMETVDMKANHRITVLDKRASPQKLYWNSDTAASVFFLRSVSRTISRTSPDRHLRSRTERSNRP
jgi:hypothetical protein